MPQLPPAEGVAQAVLNFRQDGQEVKNVLHFKATAVVETATMEQLGADLEGWYRDALQPLISNTVTLPSITIKDLGANPEPAIIHLLGPLNQGGGSNPPPPNSVTLSISARTALAGRSFRGRIYHIGLQGNQISSNIVLPATVTQLLAAYTEMLDFPVAPLETPWNYGILSYFSGGAVRGTPVFTPVTAFSSDGVIDNQRRRLPGRGA